MNRFYSLCLTFAFMALFAFQIKAQVEYPDLLITEYRGNHVNYNYIELTNTGEDTLYMNNFSIGRVYMDGRGSRMIMENDTLKFSTALPVYELPDDTLAPHDTYTLMNVFDNRSIYGYPWHNVTYAGIADRRIHRAGAASPETAKPEWECYAFDSVSTVTDYLWCWEGWGMALTYHDSSGVSYQNEHIIDMVNCPLDETYTAIDVDNYSCAGIPNPAATHIFIRKPKVKKGNTNYNLGKGTSPDDSEWNVVPFYTTQSAFTTFDTHGNYDISMESDKMDVNMEESTITIPWGNARRGDDIVNNMTIGDGMTWYYNYNGIAEDSIMITVTTGDTLDVYAVGDTLEMKSFAIKVGDAEVSMNKVFPIASINAIGAYIYRYIVTDDVPEIDMDTIFNVGFDTRVDTLLTYLEKAPKAEWEIVYVDEQERVDLKYGDKLKVTAEDGATREYFIAVNDYVASDNITLSSITWPDIPEYIPGWMGDTIPNFSSTISKYNLVLPYGTTQVPALRAKPWNLNATVEQIRATSLTGGVEDRTTTFVVTSESDSLSSEYTVTFEIEKRESQTFKGEPFITQFNIGVQSWKSAIQVVNPRGEELDMSRYMFVTSAATINPAEAIEACITLEPTEANHNARYNNCYVPGYQFTKDTAAWILNPGKLSVDPDIDPIVAPLGVFSVGANGGRPVYAADANVNKWFYSGTSEAVDGIRYDGTVAPGSTIANLKRNHDVVMLFRIDNDSILSGTKEIGDPTDFELVDILGDADVDAIWPIAGVNITSALRRTVTRKPQVYQGSTIPGYGFGTHADTSDWIVAGNASNPTAFASFGYHDMDLITGHLSTVASTVYLVSDGFSLAETIQGELSSVETFIANIIKADSLQSLTFTSGSDGTEIANSGSMSTGDTLTVVSANGINTTKYILTNQPLSDDANLILVDANAGLTIDHDAETVSGVTFGQSLKDLMAAVKAPDFALMSVIDVDNELVPLQVLNFDTIMVDTKVGANIRIEVVAQNGVNKKTYKLVPATISDDVFVTSSIFEVDQEIRWIRQIPYGISSEIFLDCIEASDGGSLSILDKADFVRTTGAIQFDDVVKVVSADESKSKLYYLKFLTEMSPDSAHVKVIDFRTIAEESILKVYPVPASDRMTIQLADDNINQFTCSLYSTTGACVYREEVFGSTKEMDVSSYKSGTYIVSVVSNGKSYKKLIVINQKF